MATPVPARKKKVSVEEYFEMLLASEVRLEFVNGEVRAMAGGGFGHSSIESNLIVAIQNRIGKKCKVLGGNQAVRAGREVRYYFPDVSVVCGGPELERYRGIDVLANPVVLIEVGSRSMIDTDQNEKFLAYTELESLREYVQVEAYAAVVRRYFRESAAETWRVEVVKGPEAELRLVALEIAVGLSEVYEGVELGGV